QAFDQQPFVLVLRKDFQKGIAGEVAADTGKGHPRLRRAPHPQVDRRDPVSALEHGGGEIELLVQLEGARLHGERPRGRARLGARVDQPHRHTLAREPQGQHEPGGPGADDQYGAAGHAKLRPALLTLRPSPSEARRSSRAGCEPRPSCTAISIPVMRTLTLLEAPPVARAAKLTHYY